MATLLKLIASFAISLCILLSQSTGAIADSAADVDHTERPLAGESVFNRHCVGCHINGGNIVRRGKTLKLAALQRNGIDSAETIATIAREGVGRMSGYGDVLLPGEDQQVAEWIWQQAQNAWIQG